MPGLLGMVKQMGWDDRNLAWESAVNKTVVACSLSDNVLHFVMEDGTKIGFTDNGQDCCEVRYMSTDDDLSYHVGATLLGFEIKNAPNLEDESGEHEVQFLEIKTSKGVISCANHNEHNGYYGGFSVQCIAE